eukprot:353822-Chlamydomonas_euryale.AAC.9
MRSGCVWRAMSGCAWRVRSGCVWRAMSGRGDTNLVPGLAAAQMAVMHSQATAEPHRVQEGSTGEQACLQRVQHMCSRSQATCTEAIAMAVRRALRGRCFCAHGR